ncbi:DNA cytosine methyltransferase [Noviherbaspirillum pedocola]|uniref:DNA (cytosine-5-)-methyltransferase n=1 Tax=Noviherbaspirillum pedocola TaxID=2801341 RepID=A0A934ST65_9BURK|nr:DNA cytosine methyltransferase [Noviherbaspirillum pedocola]MBK4736140.1 DNA cytosine methyltransferase [Noviherbaspirillum pedocola]
MPLAFLPELIIDSFAGGGGASEGLEQAFGRPVDIAINHDGEALAMHAANHPHTAHYKEDVFDVHPGFVTREQPIGACWFSPDCKHHSKAKGGKPRDQKIRGLAWVTLKWAAFQYPRQIYIENVPEFVDWAPLGPDNKPIKSERGRTFRAFIAALTTGLASDHPDIDEIYAALGADFPMHRLFDGLGYKLEYRIIRACDHDTPTIRKRVYIIARRDGLPIRWPAATHGDPKSAAVRSGELAPWRTAAECIDWSIPCPSIFERKRPLKDATLRRIAKGIMKFVVDNPDPFIVTNTTRHAPAAVDVPLPTATTGNHHYLVEPLVAPVLTEHANASSPRCMPADAPLRTVCAQVKGGHHAVIAAHITKFRTGSTGTALNEPIHTITAGGECARPAGAAHAMGLVAATLIQTGYGEREGQAPRVPGVDKPLGTIVAGGAKHALVSAFLAKHYGGVVGIPVDTPAGTVTSTDHHSVVVARMEALSGAENAEGRDTAADEAANATGAHARDAICASHLIKLRGTCQHGQAVDEPLHTVSAQGTHLGEVRAFLIKYYGDGGQWQDVRDPMHTIPTKDRLGLVTIHGEDYAIVDIGMRMLTPRELARAQGFPDSYILNPVVNGKPLSKTAQIRMIGNSVCPPVAKAIIEANLYHEREMAEVA